MDGNIFLYTHILLLSLLSLLFFDIDSYLLYFSVLKIGFLLIRKFRLINLI